MQMGVQQDGGGKDQLVKVINLWLKEQSGMTIKRPSLTKKFPDST